MRQFRQLWRVLAIVLVGSSALAQGADVPSGSSAAQVEPLTPPPLTEAPPYEAVEAAAQEPGLGVPAAERSPDNRVLRVVAGMGAGLIGAAAVGAGTLGVSALVLCSLPNGGWCTLSAVFLGLIGAAVGQPLGTFLAGYLLDGDGNLLATIAGTAAGLLLGFGVALMDLGGVNRAGLAPLLVVGAPLLLSGLAYELTSSPSAREVRERELPKLTVMPSVVPSRTGLVPALALAAHF